MTTFIIIIAIAVLLYFIFRSPNDSTTCNQSDVNSSFTSTTSSTNTQQTSPTLETKPMWPKRIFDNLDVNCFMGFEIKETTGEQIKAELDTKGISYSEYPDSGDKDGKTICLSYKFGNLDWDARLSLKNNVLTFVSLNQYTPNSYDIYQTICRELSARFNSTFNIHFHTDKSEGTETMSLENKENPWQFTEIVYDSSPILGQKNVYIRYFK